MVSQIWSKFRYLKDQEDQTTRNTDPCSKLAIILIFGTNSTKISKTKKRKQGVSSPSWLDMSGLFFFLIPTDEPKTYVVFFFVNISWALSQFFSTSFTSAMQ